MTGTTEDIVENRPLLARRDVLLGLLFWLVFCVVAVILRGVRWDEQYEFAQVVTHRIGYPADHPYLYCTRNALNLQIYLTSILYWLFPDAAIVCGARNMVYLMATVFPVFLLGAALGKRAWWGHAAAVLILMSLHHEFDASYQMFAWPSYGSTGHVGQGYALITLALLIGGHRRVGYFLLGLMPCVHIGQVPVVLGFAMLHALAGFWRGQRSSILRAAGWAVAGLAICAVVWANKGTVSVPLPTQGPYYSGEDPHRVWVGYLARDSLRALPNRPTNYTNAFLAMSAALVLCGAAAFQELRQGKRNGALWAWIWLYVAIAACAVWGSMGIHYVLSTTRIPYVFIAWMPYRFTNHATIILLAALPALVIFGGCPQRRLEPAGALVLAVAFVFGTARPFLALLLPSAVYGRYVGGGEGVLFFLCGAAAGAIFVREEDDRAFRLVWGVLCIVFLGTLAYVHQFGAVCAALGAVVRVALHIAEAKWLRGRFRTNAFALATLILCMATSVAQEWYGRQHLPMSDFEREVVRVLHERGDDNAILLARPEQYMLQAKTAHPVMADTCLAPWIPYMPTIGPGIEKLHRDFYGESFEAMPSGEPRTDYPFWADVWKQRTRDEWKSLGQEYGLRYVISPNPVPLDLPVVVKGQFETLYEIS